MNLCGTTACEVVASFASCLGVAYSSPTQGQAVWTWLEAATEGDARVGGRAASAELEGLFWQLIMNSTNAAEFEAYLAQFPNGVFRALADGSSSAASRVGGGRIPTAGSRVSGASVPASGSPARLPRASVRQLATRSVRSRARVPGLRRVPGDGGGALDQRAHVRAPIFLRRPNDED